MPRQENVLDVTSVLLRRIEVIESLREGAKDKRELVDSLNLSRSTVNRATRELEAANMVVYVDGKFAITTSGELAVNGFFDLLEKVEVTREFEEFVRWFPVEEVDLDIRAFRDAELLLPEPGNPYAMIARHVQLLKQMDYGYFLLPLTGLHTGKAAREAIVENGARAQLVVTSEVANAIESAEYPNMIKEVKETGRFELYVADELPYALNIIDDTVQIVADENGKPRAILETSSDEIHRWATDVFERYKQRATKSI